MYVGRLFPAVREKLVTIKDDAPLMEAANYPHKGTDLLIVCCSAGPCGWRRHKYGRCRPGPVSGSELHNSSFIGDDRRRRGLLAGRPGTSEIERMSGI